MCRVTISMRCLACALILGGVAPHDAGAVARHVDSSHSGARDAGEGDVRNPYKTIGYAVRNLKPGDVLTVASGVYRETLSFPEMEWNGAPTVIQAAPGADVMIKGSDVVTGWESVKPGLYVKRPWKINSQQIFVDGVALRQIGGTILNGYPEKPGHPLKRLHASQGGVWPGRVPGGLNDMTESSFHFDAASRSLYIKVPLASLQDHTVEASVRPYLAIGKGLRNVTLRNLRFQHANTTSVSQSGAISLAGDRLVLDRIEVTHVDGNGFDITGNAILVKDSRANYCGQVGMKVRGRGNRIMNSETSFNNTRGFNKWWEAGGAKFVGAGGLQDSEVAGHRAIGNNGDGIWFDWMNSNNKVHDNVSAYNAGFGIHYEASQKGYLYNNYVFANTQRGIYLPNGSASVVAHNLIVGNGMEGIAVVDERRIGPQGRPELVPNGNRIVGNIVGWNGRAAVVLPEEGSDNVSDYNLFLSGQESPSFSQGWGSRDRPVRKGLDAWRTASGQDVHSWSNSLSIPGGLAQALGAKSPNPDWSAVLATASRLKTRDSKALLRELPLPAPLLGETSPGPVQ